MIIGLSEIKKKSDEIRELASKDRIRYIMIGDKEVALFRFLTEPDSVISARFHNVKEITPRGEKYSKKYCSQTSDCRYCAQGLTSSEMIFLWTYCYHILHMAQNPGLGNNPEAVSWERVTYLGKPYYQEFVKGLRIFRTGPGKDNKYKDALVGFATEYGTFADRDYKWERSGTEKATTYTLIPKDPSSMSEEVKKIISTLPNLEKVVSGKIIAFGQEEEEVVSVKEDTSEEQIVEEVDSGSLSNVEEEIKELF